MACDSGKVKEKGNLRIKKINKEKEKKKKKKVTDHSVLCNISRWLKAASLYMQGRKNTTFKYLETIFLYYPFDM